MKKKSGRLGGRPPDLRYAIGHLIAEALQDSSAEKRAVLREIIECVDPRSPPDRSGCSTAGR
jgi:hypothetical protein